jgi:hypothetical protein
MKQFKRWNNITGWATFLIALIVYLLTIEPTASLWDCSEFIATAFKLEVGHPPGAPLFMIIGRIFSLFAGNNTANVALMMNIMSAIASAFTILFLFWTITHLARRIIKFDTETTTGNSIIIIGSGLVGALAYTFSDTFWFSAVEAEVYATSSLFTAIVFWAMLKWEDVADEKYANRWIILIAYLMGLSIGVHLLNLLTIPALVFIYYFRKNKPSLKGILKASLLSIMLLGIVMYGIIQGLFKLASWVELFFVNNMNLPYNTGIIFFSIVSLGGLFFGLYYTYKKNIVILNTILLVFSVIIIGYASYAMIVIRAYANTPINENNPNNVFSLISYLDREQYGERPLLWGQYYNAPITDVVENKAVYAPVNGKYEIIAHHYKYVYDNQFKTFFPRMYSQEPLHVMIYKDWADIRGTAVNYTDEQGKIQKIQKPTFAENLKFFVKYQVGYMYMRYFMWNFAGRQNDLHGTGGFLNGNWISGIPFIDNMRLGPQDNLPSQMINIPSRNVYFLLPLLLGLLGLVFQYDKKQTDFWVVTLLFIMTGLAIVIYLNQTPMQPRERDYAYAGSFYAFSIWIGLGLLSIYKIFNNNKSLVKKAIIITLACLVLVPGIMATQNWDDHNRSGRYTNRAIAYNYLNSCAPNAILFTFGDNDTFPLWYLQEVEGIRTDVRVVNLMLLGTDWYINQMKNKVYNSDPLPISMNYNQFITGSRSYVYLFDDLKEPINLKEAVEFVASDDSATKHYSGYNYEVDFIPGKSFTIPVDTLLVLNNGTVTNKANKIEKELYFNIKSSSINKSQLITLDIIAHNNWQRPIYFTACNIDGTLGLDEYLQLNGFAYKLVPIKTEFNTINDCGNIDTDVMFNMLMNEFDYGRMNEPDVYIDYFNIRNLSIMRFKNSFIRLAEELIIEDKTDSAIAVLDKCIELTPPDKIPEDIYTVSIANSYFKAGATDKAVFVMTHCFNSTDSKLIYYFSLKPRLRNLIGYDLRYNLQMLTEMAKVCKANNQTSLASTMENKLTNYNNAYSLKK